MRFCVISKKFKKVIEDSKESARWIGLKHKLKDLHINIIIGEGVQQEMSNISNGGTGQPTLIEKPIYALTLFVDVKKLFEVGVDMSKPEAVLTSIEDFFNKFETEIEL